MELKAIENKIVTIRGQQVILDRDIARLYDVETKRINEAVKNNPDKFPEGYVISLTADEFHGLKSKISTSSWGGVRKLPKAFTEKGLYMLATILKSPVATQTTIAIIETFAKVRELSRNIATLSEGRETELQRSVLQRSGELISDILGGDLRTTATETTVEFNLAVFKVKHTVKKEH
ncbi:ORF6N domain-containing protein [Rikenella microfusus]|uniref:ORF6N domain-containing protein n=1 Tax=Rikenella microfusus TaxID=28139 RepID=UPI00248F0B56|nr:ORF6N domain-containing protein [Rikenella microfusus]